ncbi:MAG: hypothetical protein GY939_27405, partial [Actinomycetia bacterium]|nr:hypothetical protein [Actinomycetes bacterium]
MAQALGARAAGVTTILVVTLAALTGCGGDDDTTAGDAESSSSQTSGTTPSSPAETSATNPTSSTDSTATETEITGTGSETPGSTGPAVDPAALAGRWTREVDDPCGRRYPISLDFAEHV